MFTPDRIRFFQDTIELYKSNEYEGLIKPAFNKGSVADIPNLLKRNLGLNTGKAVPSLLRDSKREAEHMIFFLIDGLGQNTLLRALSNFETRHLRDFIQNADYVPVTSLFPSTTSTATVTYHTDIHPIDHGIIGYTSYLQEIGTICNMISLSPIGRDEISIIDEGWKIPEVEKRGTIHQELDSNGVKCYNHIPNSLAQTGLTKVTSNGATTKGYFSVSHMLNTVRKEIENSTSKSLHFCYVPTIDKLSHKIGPYTEDVAVEIDALFHMIREFLIERLETREGVGISISADHGHIPIQHARVRDVRSDLELSGMLMLPITGDIRAPILRIIPDMKDQAIEHLDRKYGENYVVASSSELIAKGFFGSSQEGLKNTGNFGDIILLPKKEVGLMDSKLGILDKKLYEFEMVGMHGGLSEEEMLVPLITTSVGEK